jgi:hypothetical protein
MHVSDSGKMDF